VLDFTEKYAISAIKYALMGGQSLHVFQATDALKVNAPGPFKRTDTWAHLFDQDKRRLVGTARSLGVRRIFIHKEDTIGQHVDLCGEPLQKALDLCRSGPAQ
jgi:hypothetical protein